MAQSTVRRTGASEKRFNFHNKNVRENIFAYCMLAPDVVGLAIFFFVPILMALYLSFHQWDVLEPMKFIGLDNYKTMMGDTQWWQSVGTTLLYTVVSVPLIFCVSLLMAVFVHAVPGRTGKIFRTLFFVPYAISTVVASLIWRFILDPQRGFANELLQMVGISRQEFLGNPKQALICIAVISAWMQVGYYCIIFLSALNDIPVNYYEAARIDGANAAVIFWKITLPLLKEVSTFVLVVTTIASFQVFDLIKILTNGGPSGATNVSVYYIYQNAFDFMKIGYASSMAFVLFLIIFVVSLFQLRTTKGDPNV